MTFKKKVASKFPDWKLEQKLILYHAHHLKNSTKYIFLIATK